MANRKCIACNSQYDYCPNCGSGRLAPAWKATFCSEPCKDLWLILSRFSMNFITKSEAAEKIQSLELKDISKYVDCVKRDYNKVFEPEKKPKRGKRIEIKPIDEFADIEPVVEIEQPLEVAVPEVVFEKE
jgi:hypothetical protein